MTTANPSTAELRAWAQENGFPVGDRGRISADVLDAWKASRSSDVKASPSKPAKRSAAKPKKTPPAPDIPAQVQAETPAPGGTSDDTDGDTAQDSGTSTVAARLVALEDRLTALEHRLDSPSPTEPKPKRRSLRRSSRSKSD